MGEMSSFHDLICRVRAGDEAAAAELVQAYEPQIRQAVRRRLDTTQLRSELDSMDIAQSVLMSFFVRAATGQYDLSRPENLIKLLVRMAQNKVISHSRKRRREIAHRDGAASASKVVAGDSTPSSQVAKRELLEEVQRRLSPEERRLLDLRNQGESWAEIAAQVGGTGQALRKRLERALDRVARELGLDPLEKA